MKASEVGYAKPASLPEVFALLEKNEDARLLAGGQSLIAGLNMRLSNPTLLIDINGIAGLNTITESGGTIRIGALTRHLDLGASPLIAAKLPLIAKAVPHIAHMAIRNRGTIGGSLALSDPATELPACCLALNATMTAASSKGERKIPVKTFFKGLFETDLKQNEVLTAIEIPLPAAGSLSGFSELVRRHGDYAIVGLAAQGVRKGSSWSQLNLSYFGVGDHPVLAANASEALLADKSMADAQAVLASDLSPSEDAENSAATKLHFARVLLGRVVASMS